MKKVLTRYYLFILWYIELTETEKAIPSIIADLCKGMIQLRRISISC